MGAAGLSYEAMAKRIALRTGGLGANLATGLTADGTGNWQKMLFSVKALYRNVDEAIGIVEDILKAGDLTDAARMRDLILEKKNGLHAAVIPSGHLFAQMAAAAAFSVSAWRTEQWHGRTQLKFIAGTADRLADQGEELREKLTRLREIVFVRNRLQLNLTADEAGLRLLADAAGRLSTLPAGSPPARVEDKPPRPAHVGIAIPAQVSYVAKVLAAPPYRDPLSASLFVLAKQLSNGYLYRHIRVQGGAYGGSCRYEPLSGLFAFLSYRDPHLTETLDVYRNAVDDVVPESRFAGGAGEGRHRRNRNAGQADGPRRQGLHRPDPRLLRPERFRPAPFPGGGARDDGGAAPGNRPALFPRLRGSGGGRGLRRGGTASTGERYTDGEVDAGKTAVKASPYLIRRTK